jgi:hypothetical protein
MSFGLEVYDGSAQLLLRVTDPALRVIYRRSLSALDSGSHSLPGFNASNADAYVVSREQGKRAMAAWMSANAVNWGYDNWWPTAYVAAGELIVVARK